MFYLTGLFHRSGSGSAFQTAWNELGRFFDMYDYACHEVYDNLFYVLVGVEKTKKILIVQIDKEGKNSVAFTAMEEGLVDSAAYQHCPVRLLLQATETKNVKSAEFRQKCWNNSQMAAWVGNQIISLN